MFCPLCGYDLDKPDIDDMHLYLTRHIWLDHREVLRKLDISEECCIGCHRPLGRTNTWQACEDHLLVHIENCPDFWEFVALYQISGGLYAMPSVRQ